MSATWYQKIFGMGKQPSKNVAKERLKLVLLHDRADVSSQVFEQIQEELVHAVSKVLSKYFVINESSVDVQITRLPEDECIDGETSALVANIPISAVKDGSIRPKNNK